MTTLADFDRFGTRTVAWAGHTLHTVDVEGDGRPVVLVHGSPTTSGLWRHQIGALAALGRRVIAPDLLGQGASSAPDDGVAFPEQSAALRAVLDASALDRFDLVVHDWGGPAGLAACADRFDRIERLVLVNTTFRPTWQPPEGWEPFVAPGSGETLLVEHNAWAEGLPTVSPAIAAAPDVHEHYRAPSRRIGTRRTFLRLERLEGFETQMTPVCDALAASAPPTRIVWGTDDVYFGDEHRRLCELLPTADLVMIPGGGHFPQEDAPEATTRAIVDWVAPVR